MNKFLPLVKAPIAKHHATAVALSDDLAAHPEVSDKEFRSSQKIVEILRNAGYEVEYPYLGYPTGFRGVLKNGEGPSVAIMVEYDALPGLGHACGHNVHGSMSVLAALALADMKDSFQGTVYVFGTPAEEEAGAKVGMAEKGAFDGMALAVMNHSWSGGVNLANMDTLSLCCYLVEFRGLSAHAAAAPWAGHSALAAARKFMDLLDARRECFTPDVRCSGIFTDGGKAPNIIPDRAEVRLEFRTDSMRKLENMDEVVRKCAQGAAMALDCEVSFTHGFDSFFDMVRVPALEEAVNELFDQMGLAIAEPLPATGSSDVGNVSYHCPAIQPLVSICQAPHALHTVEFEKENTGAAAHEAIARGGELIAALALRGLSDAAFREAVHKSYEQQKARKLAP